MVRRFVVKHFSIRFLDGKMTAQLNRETDDLFSFFGGLLDVLVVFDNNMGVHSTSWKFTLHFAHIVRTDWNF